MHLNVVYIISNKITDSLKRIGLRKEYLKMANLENKCTEISQLEHFHPSKYLDYVNICNSYSFIQNNTISQITGRLFLLVETMNLEISNNTIENINLGGWRNSV
jgi:hypothetical protein